MILQCILQRIACIAHGVGLYVAGVVDITSNDHDRRPRGFMAEVASISSPNLRKNYCVDFLLKHY